MIELVFTLDYEIYGDGTGPLRDLVYEPAERLRQIFHNSNARFVNYVELAELEKIEAAGTDAAIDLVKQQIKDLWREGFEVGLHLHPQWCNARYEQGQWQLDYSEYNLCKLPRTRIARIVEQSLGYFRQLLDQPDFTPLSFRAGNWLFQPTETAAAVLAENDIRIDSSVFKGGLQRPHNLDYRKALRNGYYWPFRSDVNVPDPSGLFMEVPIYTEMVPSWKMASSKRLGFSRNYRQAGQSPKRKARRSLDFLRWRYPLKLDFCRMTLGELTNMTERVIREDRREPEVYRPLVAIGHTKDLSDPRTVYDFLSYLRTKGIPVRTFQEIYPKLRPGGASQPMGDAQRVQKGRNDSTAMVSVAPPPEQRAAASLRYVLVTPARNEAAFIEQTIKSVAAQTFMPLKWVIVSDGSTDGTDEIVNKYAAEHPWIELVRMPERKERHFAGKVLAFNAGHARLKDLDYDVIGNLDADITFDEAYFDFLIRKMAEDPRLGVAGTPFREASFQYDLRFASIEHVSGACQMFRRECFEGIGGYIPLKNGGIDLTAVITARMKGWQTRSFPEKTCEHRRKQGTAKHPTLAGQFHDGWVDYILGCDPVWQVVRCLYRLVRRRPFILSGSLCLAGYFWGMITREKQVHSPEFIRFRRSEERARLRGLIWKASPWGFGAPSKQH